MTLNLTLRTIAACGLALLAVPTAAQNIAPAGHVAPAHLIIRVWLKDSPAIRFGCAAIKITVEPQGAPALIKQTTATSSETPTPSGKCAASFAVPPGTPLTIKAHAGHMESEPRSTPPGGLWSNPVTLAPGEQRSLWLTIYGTL